jgi:two-component sensor histidine kinase
VKPDIIEALRNASNRIQAMELILKALVKLHGTQMISNAIVEETRGQHLRITVEGGEFTKLWLQPQVEVTVE